MPPRPKGMLLQHEWRDGTTVSYGARVRAYGQRYRLDFGTNVQGWSKERAAIELERIVGQIIRGTWEPPQDAAPAIAVEDLGSDETFHLFASRWWQDKRATLSPNARNDYEWRLAHLLGFFAQLEVRTLTVRDVDRYRAAKLREREALAAAQADARRRGRRLPARRPLSNRSINMTIDLLAQILDAAVEYELLDVNPARGKRRRLPAERKRRSFLEPDMVVDLLDAAQTIEERVPAHQRYGRRALLMTLCLAGPRIAELTQAKRADVDLAGGRLRTGVKTEAGLRDIEMTAVLVDELRAHLQAMSELGRPARASTPIFCTRTGGEHNASNIRNRLLTEAVRLANEKREAAGEMLIGAITPHSLRRTFASLALAAGRDPRFVMAQLGHTDARLTLTIYAQVMQRQRVDEALIWRLMRFPDEPESRSLRAPAKTSGPKTGPMGDSGVSEGNGKMDP